MTIPTITRAATVAYLINHRDDDNPNLVNLTKRLLGDDYKTRTSLDPDPTDDLAYLQDDEGYIAAIYIDGSEEGFRGEYHDAYDEFIANGGTLEIDN
jgi:hypothetical protein